MEKNQKDLNFRTPEQINNKESKSVLFFTAANQPYEHFTPLYIFFTLYHNHNGWVEICLEDSDRFIEENRDCIKFLNEIFPNRFHLRSTNNFMNVFANSVRFIETPAKYKCDYVYIGDIDILILEKDIGEQHIKHIKTNNLPFSNIIRPNTLSDKIPKLTGLHFAPWDVQYPLPDVSDLPLLKMNDEQLLYTMMKRKGVMVPESVSYRPVHGIHVSPNRNPFGKFNDRGEKVRPGWGISAAYCQKFVEITKSREFQEFYYQLPIQARNYITLVDNIAHKNYNQFADFAQKNLAVEQSASENSEYLQKLKKRALKYRDFLLLNKKYDLALRFQLSLVSILPSDAQIWHQLAWQLIGFKKYERAIIAQKQAIKIQPNNSNFLKQLDRIRNLERNRQTETKNK